MGQLAHVTWGQGSRPAPAARVHRKPGRLEPSAPTPRAPLRGARSGPARARREPHRGAHHLRRGRRGAPRPPRRPGSRARGRGRVLARGPGGARPDAPCPGPGPAPGPRVWQPGTAPPPRPVRATAGRRRTGPAHRARRPRGLRPTVGIPPALRRAPGAPRRPPSPPPAAAAVRTVPRRWPALCARSRWAPSQTTGLACGPSAHRRSSSPARGTRSSPPSPGRWRRRCRWSGATSSPAQGTRRIWRLPAPGPVR